MKIEILRSTASAGNYLIALMVLSVAAHGGAEPLNFNRAVGTNYMQGVLPSDAGELPVMYRQFQTVRMEADRLWTNQIGSVYFPSSGLAWTGRTADCHLVVFDSKIWAFIYEPWSSSFWINISTNHYLQGITNVMEVFKKEEEKIRDENYPSRRPYPGYHFSVRDLFSVEAMESDGSKSSEANPRPHLVVENKMLRGWAMPSGFRWKDVGYKLQSVEVVSSNIVITLYHDTNQVSKIAFDGKLRPVWATTNGVSIGDIPTTCVFYSDIVSNKTTLHRVY